VLTGTTSASTGVALWAATVAEHHRMSPRVWPILELAPLLHRMELGSLLGGAAACAVRLAVVIGLVVTSDALGMVPTGGELTLCQAVGVGPDHLSLCRSSPVGDVRRGLMGAWHRRAPR
jgi:hypothetical protein